MIASEIKSYMFYVNSAGYLANNLVSRGNRLRPTISISSEIKVIGSGTAIDPYRTV